MDPFLSYLAKNFGMIYFKWFISFLILHITYLIAVRHHICWKCFVRALYMCIFWPFYFSALSYPIIEYTLGNDKD